MMRITRDSALLWLTSLGAVFAYFQAAATAPTAWTWNEWTQFAVFLISIFVGKLQSSPLPSKQEVKAIEAQAEATKP
jgi:hypothetical protein